jgi:hypothetical protein
LTLIGAGSLVAEELPPPIVTVTWENPDSYLDVRATIEPQGSFEERLFAALGRFIEVEASKILSPGQKLQVTVHNLDMAGYIERSMLQTGDWIRVVKDLDHVMIEIEHQLVDASGEVLSELRKMYSKRPRWQRSAATEARSFQYEKQVILEWLRSLE